MEQSSRIVRTNCFLNSFRAGEPVGNTDHQLYFVRHK